MHRELTCVCSVCGCFDVPAVLDRQALPAHVDPLSTRLCPNRDATVMLLRVPDED